MAKIIIDGAVEGPLVHIQINGTPYALATDEELTVTASQLNALDNGGVAYERVYRSTTVTMSALTIDTATIASDASEDDPVGTLDDFQSGSTLSISDDPSGGMFVLDGADLLVGATALVEDTYDIGSPRPTTR